MIQFNKIDYCQSPYLRIIHCIYEIMQFFFFSQASERSTYNKRRVNRRCLVRNCLGAITPNYNQLVFHLSRFYFFIRSNCRVPRVLLFSSVNTTGVRDTGCRIDIYELMFVRHAVNNSQHRDKHYIYQHPTKVFDRAKKGQI